MQIDALMQTQMMNFIVWIENMYSSWAVKMHAFIALLFQTKLKLTYLSYRTKNVGYKLIFLKMIGSMTLTPEVGM